MFGGIGSEAISAVPILAKVIFTSGNALMRFSSAACMPTDWVRLVPGIRRA